MKVGGGRAIMQTHHSVSQSMPFIECHSASSQFTQGLEKLSIQSFIICLNLLSVYSMLMKYYALEELCITSIYSMPTM